MAEEFVMPKLGLTMEAGTIVRWLVADDSDVAPGDSLLVIETDKVESEVEATKAGRLHRAGEVGQEYPCGARIGWFLGVGEEAPALVGAAVASSPAPSGVGRAGRLLASPNAKRVAALRGIDLASVAGTGPGGRITSEDVPESGPPMATGGPRRTVARGGGSLATAAARILADLLGVDLAEVEPWGTDPRITRDDVAAYVRSALARSNNAGTSAPTPIPTPMLAPQQDPSKVVPLTGMRGTIAKRMSDSLHSMAQLTLTMDVNMDGVVAHRASRAVDNNDSNTNAARPTFTDYVIAAVAAALVEHRLVNSQITEAGVALLPQVNVGLAIAIEDGLIVGVIHDTPALSLEEVAVETSRLASAAREGALTLPELEGGTFAVTSLGMFGVDGFTPIINGPNTAILGVGRLRDEVAWTDSGSPAKTQRMTLSLTWDHRAFDGVPAAEFARTVKANLETW